MFVALPLTFAEQLLTKITSQKLLMCQGNKQYLVLTFLFYRRKRMSFVTRSKGSRQRKKSWSSNWRAWMPNQDSYLHLLRSLLHLLPKAKLLATSWFPSLVILGLLCGSSCHLLLLIPRRIMFSVHQLPKSAVFELFGYVYPKGSVGLLIVLDF